MILPMQSESHVFSLRCLSDSLRVLLRRLSLIWLGPVTGRVNPPGFG